MKRKGYKQALYLGHILPGGHPPSHETRTESKRRKFFSSKANSHSFIPPLFLFPISWLCPSWRPTFSRSLSSSSQNPISRLFLSSILPAFPQSQSAFSYFDSFAFLLSSSIACIGSISHCEFRYHIQFDHLVRTLVKTSRLMTYQWSEGNEHFHFSRQFITCFLTQKKAFIVSAIIFAALGYF